MSADAPVQIAEIDLVSHLKSDTASDPQGFATVQLSYYTVVYSRRDGGKVVPAPETFAVGGVLPAGGTATLTFTGFQVAWMSTQGPTRGSATVKLDSGTAATINTNTSSPHAAEIVDVVTAAANGSHKLVVNVLGTSGHPRIDVDAFIVLSK